MHTQQVHLRMSDVAFTSHLMNEHKGQQGKLNIHGQETGVIKDARIGKLSEEFAALAQ